MWNVIAIVIYNLMVAAYFYFVSAEKRVPQGSRP
jgi:hypothetical protein